MACLDSLEASKEIIKLGLVKDTNYLYKSPYDTVDKSNISLGDLAPKGCNIVMKMPILNEVWYVFPIKRLSYYKQAIIESNTYHLKEQNVKFNDRLNINFIEEKYYYGNNEIRLLYYESFGAIKISATDCL